MAPKLRILQRPRESISEYEARSRFGMATQGALQMGTDIHLAVQRREGDVWRRVERWVKDLYWEPGDIAPEIVREGVLVYRNYVLFAALAGVRNYGFTDAVTGGPLTPVAAGRGLPEDFASEMLGEYHEGTFMGDHSFTWMLLSEIEVYEWERKIVRRGWVSAAARAIQLEQQSESPWTWRLGSGDDLARRIPLVDLDAEIRSGKIDPSAYAEMTWEKSMESDCETFLVLLPALRALAPRSEDIRLVMGFDS